MGFFIQPHYVMKGNIMAPLLIVAVVATTLFGAGTFVKPELPVVGTALQGAGIGTLVGGGVGGLAGAGSGLASALGTATFATTVGTSAAIGAGVGVGTGAYFGK
jgi:hypothetical protein